MLRKIFLAVSAAFLIATASLSLRAANIPLFSGPSCAEASQIVSCLNQLVQSVNSGVAGYYAAVIGPVTSTATTVQQTLGSITVPTSTLSAPGQSLRIRCYGTTSSDSAGGSGTKNIALSFGSDTISTGAFGNTATADPWELELLVTAATSTNTVAVGRGSIATGALSANFGVPTVTPTATNDLVDLLTSAQTVACKETSGATTASATMYNLYVEQVK